MGVQLDLVRHDRRDLPIGTRGVVIGRGSDCDIVIDATKVSRHHARIYNDATGCWAEDLGSTNGTSVNGRRVDGEPAALSNGDRIRVGDAEMMVLRGESTTFGAPPDDQQQRRPQPARPTSVELALKPLTIGRDRANVLALDDPNVSRFHAVIEPRQRGVVLRDLSSRNGTRVNGRTVSRVLLAPGDQIAIGAYRFTFTGSGLDPVDDCSKLRLESCGVTVSVGSSVLLTPTSLTIEPGELVAIIGESGAGKTTLLKALAGITRPTGGQVLANGEPVETRLTDIGYVPQDDIVHRLLTVREALRYAARLRLPPDTSAAEVERGVDRVMVELGLQDRADVRVDRLSGGQRKRVGVAAELLSRPGILFLDEPATGLDPGLEKRLMELLRKLSRDGRPIVTITHSTKHLPLCDKLAVMAAGGVLCFYGAPADALRFFAVQDYDDIYEALDKHPVEHWQRRPAGQPQASPTATAAKRGPSAGTARDREPPVIPQAAVLARRYATLMLRDRRNLAILIGQVPILALLITIGFNSDIFSSGGPTPKINAPTFLFFSVITAMWLGSIAAAREIVKEKSVFLRERAVGVSVNSYLLSKTVVLFALCAVQTLILAGILFGLHPLHAGELVYVAVVSILLITSLAAVGLGLLASTLARSEDQATSFIPLILIPELLFGGSIITLVGKGLGIRLLAAAMLARWSFAGLGAATSLGQSPEVFERYRTLFSHSVLEFVVIVAVFAAVALSLVWLRLTAQHD